MLYLGLLDNQKIDIINRYVTEKNIKKVIFFSPVDFDDSLINCEVETFGFSDCCTIRSDDKHKEPTWYRLCSEINAGYLIVCNEFMRTAHRGHVSYNALHSYQLRTPHRLVFNYLPVLESVDDLAILFRLSTTHNTKGLQLSEIEIPPLELERRHVEIRPFSAMTPKVFEFKHEEVKNKLIAEAESSVNFDPENIPRRLYKAFDKNRLKAIPKCFEGRPIVGRGGDCIGFDSLTRRDNYVVVSSPYTSNQFSILAGLHETGKIDWMMLDLKCDSFYLKKFKKTIGEMEKAYDYLTTKV